MAAYYNEIDPYAAEWLRNLIKAGHIADGEVDTRSIEIVEPDDIRGFTQCHFFAGIAGWSHALRLAGWADERPIWTGSCPCQPFSVAGKGAGTDDPRHLWPHFFRLIRACRPPVVMGEQVAGKAGYGWFDGVRSDLEGEGYASRAVDVPACAVNAPHIRQRLYWVADTESIGRGGRPHDEDEGRREQPSADPCEGSGDVADASGKRELSRPDECASDGGSRIIMAGAEPRRDGLDSGSVARDVADAAGRRSLEPINPPVSTKGMGSSQFEGHSGSDVVDAIGGGQQGDDGRRPEQQLEDADACVNVADADDAGRQGRQLLPERAGECSAWSDGVEWRRGADGKTRRVGADFRKLVDGFSAGMVGLRPDCYAEAKKEVDKYASAIQGSAVETMRTLWRHVQQEQTTEWPVGECPRIYAKEVLLSFLRQLASACNEAGESGSCAETAAREMRGVRNGREATCSPCEWESGRQYEGKHTDALHSLSWILAQYAGEVWETYCRENAAPMRLLTANEPARVGKLRAFGNAIVPPLAAEVVRAFMESQE